MSVLPFFPTFGQLNTEDGRHTIAFFAKNGTHLQVAGHNQDKYPALADRVLVLTTGAFTERNDAPRGQHIFFSCRPAGSEDAPTEVCIIDLLKVPTQLTDADKARIKAANDFRASRLTSVLGW